MKWVRVNKSHFNIDMMQGFYWLEGRLYIYWVGERTYSAFEDPNQENYLRICRTLGVSPIEEDSLWKKQISEITSF